MLYMCIVYPFHMLCVGDAECHNEKKRQSNRRLSDECFYEIVKQSCHISEEASNNDNCLTELQLINEIRRLISVLTSTCRKSTACCISIGKYIYMLKTLHKVKDKQLNDLFKDFKGFSKPNRIFFIKLYHLSVKFPKVAYIGINYSDIRQRLSSLERYMMRDVEFWQKL